MFRDLVASVAPSGMNCISRLHVPCSQKSPSPELLLVVISDPYSVGHSISQDKSVFTIWDGNAVSSPVFTSSQEAWSILRLRTHLEV